MKSYSDGEYERIALATANSELRSRVRELEAEIKRLQEALKRAAEAERNRVDL